MRVIIAGSRTIEDYDLVKKAIKDSGFDITEVVSGGAIGVDCLGEWWAEENDIPVKEFTAYWHIQGKPAGILRNQQMALYANALIAVWDGKSKGTKHMIEYMRDKMMKPTLILKSAE